MNHHKSPPDLSGPEFEGLTHDEAFDLKKQLRIRDRDRMARDHTRALTEWRADERDAAARRFVATFAILAAGTLFAIGFYIFH